jgi:hypothetical protein
VICSAFSSTTYTTTAALNPGVGGGAVDNWNGAGPGGWAGAAGNKWIDGRDQNAIDNGGNHLSLGALDLVIDMVESNVAEPVENNEWMFLMSPSANSRLAQLLINQQRFVDTVEIAAGLVVPTYRGIPIIKTSFLSARTNVFGTVTAAASAGGSLASGTARNYRVGAVMARYGAIQASANAAATPASTNLSVTLTLPAR